MAAKHDAAKSTLSLDADLPSLNRPLRVYSFEDVMTEKEIVGRLERIKQEKKEVDDYELEAYTNPEVRGLLAERFEQYAQGVTQLARSLAEEQDPAKSKDILKTLRQSNTQGVCIPDTWKDALWRNGETLESYRKNTTKDLERTKLTKKRNRAEGAARAAETRRLKKADSAGHL
jgi:hypothetical protein